MSPFDATPPVDAAVIGGSFAGLTAALYLARARCTVALFDDGLTRNRFATAGHGFLGMDGRSPEEMRAAGRRDVLAYPTVTLHEERVISVCSGEESFRLQTATGRTLAARRLVLACGMRDLLPELDGLAACWGRTVLQCPYCHGYEMADRPTGILFTGAPSLHQARILGDWSDDLVLFANGHEIAAEDRADLAARGIDVVEPEVARLEQRDGRLVALHLADGSKVARDVLYMVSEAEPACDLARQLGCAHEDGPFGPYVAVDDVQMTSVPGIYAAGDLARIGYSATWAAADGARAGAFCHQSLRVDANPYAKG
ncbi:NAD(P)/FAD-dependent oxidoreductase [Pontivivens ytuae]|uniref:Thioredoxin reductase n=1 Tax=Pontivivens ytuae TaxID=2789856 RepID=A0A7S9LTI2_9RHOB|nr:NAD(P)/FAD-dependent oxidoreductase [Pontivivens ytuae]QPH54450.1 NAD(P)/FAD-dependent oxidoreductase [Pontivivens ytuae]